MPTTEISELKIELFVLQQLNEGMRQSSHRKISASTRYNIS